MNLKKLTQGFTLVEMLVVIAIIAILAAALFPAISTAMDMARATALKSKSKGIWNAILVANNEREPLGKSPLWPEDVAKNSTSTEYFQYLLSDGDGTPTDVQDDRLVSDLSFDTFSAPGVVTAVSASEFDKDHIAWRAGKVGSKSPLDLPFLVTRNIEGDSFSCSGPDDEGKVMIIGAYNAAAVDYTGELICRLPLEVTQPFLGQDCSNVHKQNIWFGDGWRSRTS